MSKPDTPENPKDFSPSWHQKQLLQKANYVPSDDFPVLWTWETGSGNQGNRLMVAGEGDPEEVCCRVVGIISDDRPYLDMHGNFNPKFNTPMHKSRLQFSLKNPNDSTFGPDFSLAYKRLEDAQDRIATGSDRSWFLMDGTMRFSFPLWEIKDDGNSGPEETKLTEDYNMRSEFSDAKVETQDSYQIRIMRVSRWADTQLVLPSKFATALPGSLVDVTFGLKHHYIKAKDKGVNSYTAFVHEVIILQPPPRSIRSPFLNRKVGGALSVSQSPRKSPSKVVPSSGEQQAATAAFRPGPTLRGLEKRKKPDSETVASSSKRPRDA